jgi:hypothetical protein
MNCIFTKLRKSKLEIPNNLALFNSLGPLQWSHTFWSHKDRILSRFTIPYGYRCFSIKVENGILTVGEFTIEGPGDSVCLSNTYEDTSFADINKAVEYCNKRAINEACQPNRFHTEKMFQTANCCDWIPSVPFVISTVCPSTSQNN